MYENIGIDLYKELEQTMENYGVVNEAYIGKTPNILKAEQAMEEICQFIKNREAGKTNGKVMKQKAYKDLVKYLSDEFEIKNFRLEFTDGYAVGKYGKKQMSMSGPMNIVGATTIPMVTDIQNLIKNVAFKSGNTDKIAGAKNVCIFMQSTLVTSYGLNSEEMMAMLLHEIGHSFNMNILMTAMMVLSFIHAPSAFLRMSLNGFFNAKVLVSTASFMNRIMPEFLSRIFRKLNVMFTSYMQSITPPLFILNFIKTLENTLFNPKLSLNERKIHLYNIITTGLTGYAAERHSDSFASAYGYGYGLSSGLRKITYMSENTEKMLEKGADTTAFDIISALGSTLTAFIDPHPATLTRVKNQINKLKRDLAKVEDPDMKKEIETQINQIQNLYDNYFTKENTTTEMNKYIAMLDKVLKGDDWQSMLFEPFYRIQEV